MSPKVFTLAQMGWDDTWARAMVAAAVPDARPARVVRCDRGFAQVCTGDEVRMVPTVVHVVTGDWVALVDGQMVTVLPRHGLLRRREADGIEQLLAANVDLVVLVCGLDRPVRPGRINRGLVQAGDADASALIVLTKADLEADPGAAAAALAVEVPGATVLAVSSRSGEGMDALRQAMTGRTSALIGESGAGKSTLLNALTGVEVAGVGAVRAGDAKGRHTTTRRELHVAPGVGPVIDTPGLRAFGLAADDETVDAAFPDIDELAGGCRFRNCLHDGEPDCAVAAAVEAGALSVTRHAQYIRLQHEVAGDLQRSKPYEQRRMARRTAYIERQALRRRSKGRS